MDTLHWGEMAVQQALLDFESSLLAACFNAWSTVPGSSHTLKNVATLTARQMNARLSARAVVKF